MNGSHGGGDALRPPFQLFDNGDEKGISMQGGWTIRSVKKAIANTSREEQLTQQLRIKLPAMLFDANGLHVEHQPTGFRLTFNAVDALKLVGQADPNIKVKAAARWSSSNKHRSDVEITTIEHASDWTFTTAYSGSVSQSCVTPSTQPDIVPIDYDALRDVTLPILYSSEVVLFEDELDDNGTASYRVRVRVMPSFIFILARFFLRVDGVLMRINDTRYFHRFGTPVVVRELVNRQADLTTTLSNVPVTLLRDPDMISPQVPVIFTKLDNILISDCPIV